MPATKRLRATKFVHCFDLGPAVLVLPKST